MSLIESHQNTAALERLWSHTVAITNTALTSHGTDPQTGLPAREEETPGTGVAAVWGKQHLILTAKHVVEQARVEDLRFFVRQKGELKTQHASEVTMQDALEPVPLNDLHAKIHRCEHEDLAAVTLRADALGTLLEFFDASSWIDPPEGETVFGVGYPCSYGVIRNGNPVGSVIQKSVILCPMPFNGIVQPSTSGHAFRDFDPKRHYLIPYEHGRAGKHPKGISGAAWVQSDERQQVWSAKYTFAGLCTSCYRDGTVEQIVKASVVQEFLAQTFGQ